MKLKLLIALVAAPLLALSIVTPVRADNVSDDTVKAYVEGVHEASCAVAIHDKPKAGQMWKTQWEDKLGKTTWTRVVVKVDGNRALVEARFQQTGDFLDSDYVFAYELDLDKDPDDGNVLRAWIGLPHAKPQKVKSIMKQPDEAEREKLKKRMADSTKGEEDFKDLELAGKKWSGTVTRYESGKRKWSVWKSAEGWFNGVVKRESDGKTGEHLVETGDNAKAALDWPKELLDSVRNAAPKAATDTPKDGKQEDKNAGKKD